MRSVMSWLLVAAAVFAGCNKSSPPASTASGTSASSAPGNRAGAPATPPTLAQVLVGTWSDGTGTYYYFNSRGRVSYEVGADTHCSGRFRVTEGGSPTLSITFDQPGAACRNSTRSFDLPYGNNNALSIEGTILSRTNSTDSASL